MDIQWRVDPIGPRISAARSRRMRDAFADPLEGAEWHGLAWTVPLVAALIAGARSGAGMGWGRGKKIEPVQRFTAPVAAHGPELGLTGISRKERV